MGVMSADDPPIDLQEMPDDLLNVWYWVNWFSVTSRQGKNDVRAILEKVGGFMGAGAGEEGNFNRASGHTMFKFGMSYGILKMALVAAGIPFLEVPPQTWQKEFGIKRKKGEKKHTFKRRIRLLAQKLFPDVKVTACTADALLLTEYGRREYTRNKYGARKESER